MNVKRISKRITGAFLFLCVAAIAWANITINRYEQYTFDHLEQIPPAYCAIVLGTTKFLKNGRENHYYTNRITAAVRLYRAGKCQKIIVSGDNRTHAYNEARDMKNDIVKQGVNERDIVCDFAGLRTLDSIVRFKEVFNQQKGIVVSQKFHNSRAIYIGRSWGIELYGYNADDVDRHAGIKTRIREVFSKVICVLDIELFKTRPKHLGDRIPV